MPRNMSKRKAENDDPADADGEKVKRKNKVGWWEERCESCMFLKCVHVFHYCMSIDYVH